MTTYDEYLNQLKEHHKLTAKEGLQRLYELLKLEDPLMSNEDIYDRMMKDCLVIWQKKTIQNNMPDELKDPERQEAGKKGVEKKKEIIVTTNSSVAPESGATLPEPEPERFNSHKTLKDLQHSHITFGNNDNNDDKEGIIKDQKVEIDKLKESLEQLKKQHDETIKSVNAIASQKKNIPVIESLEYKALESKLYILDQENKDLKQIAQMQMKQNPGDTFKPASEIQASQELKEVEFPARDLSTLFMDSRNAKQIMYLQLEGNKVIGWESDAKRMKRP